MCCSSLARSAPVSLRGNLLFSGDTGDAAEVLAPKVLESNSSHRSPSRSQGNGSRESSPGIVSAALIIICCPLVLRNCRRGHGSINAALKKDRTMDAFHLRGRANGSRALADI